MISAVVFDLILRLWVQITHSSKSALTNLPLHLFNWPLPSLIPSLCILWGQSKTYRIPFNAVLPHLPMMSRLSYSFLSPHASLWTTTLVQMTGIFLFEMWRIVVIVFSIPCFYTVLCHLSTKGFFWNKLRENQDCSGYSRLTWKTTIEMEMLVSFPLLQSSEISLDTLGTSLKNGCKVVICVLMLCVASYMIAISKFMFSYQWYFALEKFFLF